MQLFPGAENTPRSIDPEKVVKQYRFKVPMYIVYFISGIAIVRFYGYSWNCWRIQLNPIFNGLWGIWLLFLAIVIAFGFVNWHMKRDPIQPWQASTFFILACIAIAACVGDALQKGVC